MLLDELIAVDAPAQDCPLCGNSYIQTRYDIHKDGRPFTYCDCCGALADKRLWNLALSLPGRPYGRND